jgi:hypothetical protein
VSQGLLNDIAITPLGALAGYYATPQYDLLRHSLAITVYMFAWEFLFHGFSSLV